MISWIKQLRYVQILRKMYIIEQFDFNVLGREGQKDIAYRIPKTSIQSCITSEPCNGQELTSDWQWILHTPTPVYVVQVAGGMALFVLGRLTKWHCNIFMV